MKTEKQMLTDYIEAQGLTGVAFTERDKKYISETTGFRLYVLGQSINYLRADIAKDNKVRNAIVIVVLSVWVASMVALTYAICGSL